MIKPKRPPSVWISQIILILYSILFTWVLATELVVLSSMNFTGHAIFVVIISVLVAGTIIGVLVGAFSGLGKRRSWARWLTVGILSILILSFVLRVLASGDLQVSPMSLLVEILGSISFIVLFGLLVLRLIVGKAANDYFNPVDDLENIAAPPPPPTFAE